MKRNRFFLSLLFMVLIVLFVILFFTWLGRENIKNDSAIREVAKEEVDKLFSLYNEGEYAEIYDLSCDSFKNATARKDFLTVMGTKMKILGEFKGRKLQYSNVINSKSVGLYYRVDYINYSLIEEFNYIKNDGQKICLQAMYTDDAGKHGEVIKLH
ncbi:sugar tyrosine-protein kinase [Salmonella enterica]|uniref:sugar tyrosine-protein kinase n=1 Tax=Salmonella enterica TaxID=28901 RepID=UPI0009ACD322|nr:sugar tyrosine-protein kinase [Salmonella enterica]EAM6396604.1 sugar tyrosine-protein kinase [Salmonella enterica]EAN4591997.1 sugar tyrosine-protein kinase [Salmonella enterica]EAS2829170.1 sugar tyrosine-protein kinase [Salmonella enterica]EAU0360187.1 sugar tyrosine-protein kinase [Salmonella enterica]EAU0843995.1 sugar tyrosine-protein kinase [Salmonella enterica]